eukprot:5007280-Pleurochrysis_carterae.AAC.1
MLGRTRAHGRARALRIHYALPGRSSSWSCVAVHKQYALVGLAGRTLGGDPAAHRISPGFYHSFVHFPFGSAAAT